MNFSIHIKKETAIKLKVLVKKTGKTRNALINEAIEQYLQSEQPSEWPKEVWELFGSYPELTPFEDYRKELKEPEEVSFD